MMANLKLEFAHQRSFEAKTEQFAEHVEEFA
jgi:hypothetical protein